MSNLTSQKREEDDPVFWENNKMKKIKIVKNNTWMSSSKIKLTSKNKNKNKRPQQFINRKMVSFSDYVGKDNEMFTKDENLPQRIEGSYIHDYNILYIHNILLKKFSQDKKNNLSTFQNNIIIEKDNIEKLQTLIDRKRSRKLIEYYTTEIDKLINNYTREEYLLKSKKYIEEYKKLGSIYHVVSFISNDKNMNIVAPENENIQKKRHSIIFNYLEICRKYIVIDLIRDLPNLDCCPGCGVNIKDHPVVEDETGSSICSNCCLERINIIRQPFYTDGTRVNNSRNNYEDRINFEKVLDRYQGKQNNKPPVELYNKLDIWFKKHGLKSSTFYQSLSVNEEGKKDGTSRSLMYKALGDIKCSGYYDDINLIMNVFWGWKLPNVSFLEERIMKDYDLFQIIYEEVLDKEGRKSSLNSQWRLYKHLKKLGHKCKKIDFKTPTTPNILEYHRRKWKEGCNILGWKN